MSRIANPFQGCYLGAMPDFKEKMRSLMRTKGLTQASLAEKASSTQGRIGDYMTGRRSMRIDTAIKIADALEVSMDYLFRDEPPKPEVSAEEREILGLVKILGLDEAKRRLIVAPVPLESSYARPTAVRDRSPNPLGIPEGVPNSDNKTVGAVSPKGGKPRRGS